MPERTSILLAHRYFWPDTAPYGLLLRQIAAGLADQSDWDVTVFTGQPAYSSKVVAEGNRPREEWIDGKTQVLRARMLPERRLRSIARLINAISFSLQLAIRILRSRPNVVMCSTQPPVFGAAMARLATALSNGKFVYHLQDIHPEVAWAGGLLKKSFLSRMLHRVDVHTTCKADHIVVLSADMAATVQERIGHARPGIHVIQNLNLPNYSGASVVPVELRKRTGVFRLMFAGNVGRFQGLHRLTEAMNRVRVSQEVELVIMGDGKAKAELQQQAESSTGVPIRFFSHQPLSIAEPLMADADMCIVSLSPGIYRYAFPSKVVSYLSLGCPLFVIAEPDSELGQFPERFGVGYSCDSSSTVEIVSAIEQAVEFSNHIAGFRYAAKDAWETHFSPKMIRESWLRLFQSCLLLKP